MLGLVRDNIPLFLLDTTDIPTVYRTEIATPSLCILKLGLASPSPCPLTSHQYQFDEIFLDPWRGVLPPLVSVAVVRTISFSIYWSGADGGIKRLTGEPSGSCESCQQLSEYLHARLRLVCPSLPLLLTTTLTAQQWHQDSISSTCLFSAFQADQTQQATGREGHAGGWGLFTLLLDVASVSVRSQYHASINMIVSSDFLHVPNVPFPSRCPNLHVCESLNAI